MVTDSIAWDDIGQYDFSRYNCYEMVNEALPVSCGFRDYVGHVEDV